MSQKSAKVASETATQQENKENKNPLEAKHKTNDSKARSKDVEATPTRESRVRVAAHMEPTFYIGGGNGNAIIDEICTEMGWKRITDKKDDGYRLKWCELKQSINYYSFREGEQMVNHIPNCNLLTNKLGLVNSLQEYDRMCQAVKKRALRLDFIPETFRLDDPRDRNVFRQIYQDGENWICKPTGKNQGKGIFIIKSQEEVNKIFEEQEERTHDGKPLKPLNRIIQRYINNPLLLNKKKFDIRCYMLIANTVPYLVLYHKGYIRLTIYDYDDDTDNLIAHLTNQYIQKKDPSYKEVKEDTTWSMEKFNDYLNDNYQHEKGIEKDWAFTVLPGRIKQIMTYCFHCVKSRLHCKIGYHDLYGFDFMIDDNMKVWLIEVNVNPSLAINCEALKQVIPSVVKDTIHITNECFEKSRRGRALLPLNSQAGFEIIYSHGSKTAIPRKSVVGSPYRKDMLSRQADIRQSSSALTRRPATGMSPTKEPAVVAPSLEANVTQIAKQYTINKQGSTNKNVSSIRVRNTPVATPTIITPGSGLPVTQRSKSFAQLKGTTPPANAASSLKVSQNNSNTSKQPRPPTRNGPSSSKSVTDSASNGVSKQSDSATAVVKPKQSTAEPSGAKSTSAHSKSSNVIATKDSSKVKGQTSPSTNEAVTRKTLSSEPPHHNNMKKELKNKMTAAEAIVIRNMTKQNIQRKSYDKKIGQTKTMTTAQSDSLNKSKSLRTPFPPAATTTKTRSEQEANTSSNTDRHTSRTPTTSPSGSECDDGELTAADDEADVSTAESGDGDAVETKALAEKQLPENNNTLHDQSNTMQEPEVQNTPRQTNSNDVSKKITLHLSPHGSRGSKDGGKPNTSMRFAAMYPSSPYVENTNTLLPMSSNSVAQLRMTHNGVVQRQKRGGGDVKSDQEKLNRGS